MRSNRKSWGVSGAGVLRGRFVIKSESCERGCGCVVDADSLTLPPLMTAGKPCGRPSLQANLSLDEVLRRGERVVKSRQKYQ